MEKMFTLHELTLGILTILILVFLFTLGLLIYSFRAYKLEINRKYWKNMLNDYLMQVLVEGNQTDLYIDPNLSELLKHENFRRFFLGQLIEADRKFSGVAAAVLQRVFYSYQLDKESYSLLRSYKGHLIARGIQALTIMDVRLALPEIESKLNHRKKNVVHEVQYAMVHFNGFEGLSFLDSLEGILSDWQQLRILNNIKSLPKNATEKISKWLESNNPSVLHFALKLVRKFQIFELHDQVVALLADEQDLILKDAIKTLFSLDAQDTSSLLAIYYPKMKEDLQLEILRGFGQTRAFDQLEFLRSQLMDNPTNRIKVSAAEALANLGEFKYLIDLSNKLAPEDPTLMVLNHALQKKS
ncbi:hypothetical protein [Sphingobacterium sp.]|uniref:hypothetical protein n=1 Tax=Sphingobacterium sp. TaxID=341027 RepID=UPI0028AF1864|nr:hypothetical protein [Sphingobacterium sp.]